MAFANSQVSDLIATTIESRSRKCADNLTNNNPLLMAIKEKGREKPVSGGSIIMQEIYYNDPATNTVNSFSGFETINIGVDSPISGATFNLKHYADSVAISGSEMLANSGKEQMIDLLSTRIEIAEARLLNKIDLDLHGSETGNGGKNLSGLADAFTTTPTTGVYGNIDRANSALPFWRQLYRKSSVDFGGAATSATIQSHMSKVGTRLVRGKDFASLIYAGQSAFEMYLASLLTIQRVVSDGGGEVGAGFASLKFYGAGQAADVVLGGGIGGNAGGGSTFDNSMLFINPKYFMFRPHKDRNFVPIGGDRQSVNQDAVVRLFGWSGALTCSGLQFQGRFDIN